MVEPSRSSKRSGSLDPRERWSIVCNHGAIGHGRALFPLGGGGSEVIGRDHLASVVSEQGAERGRLDGLAEEVDRAVGEGTVGSPGSLPTMGAEDAGRGDLRIGEEIPIIGLGPSDGALI